MCLASLANALTNSCCGGKLPPRVLSIQNSPVASDSLSSGLLAPRKQEWKLLLILLLLPVELVSRFTDVILSHFTPYNTRYNEATLTLGPKEAFTFYLVDYRFILAYKAEPESLIPSTEKHRQQEDNPCESRQNMS